MCHPSKDAVGKVLWVIVDRVNDAVQLTGRLLKQLPVDWDRRRSGPRKGRVFLIVECGHRTPGFVRRGRSRGKLERGVTPGDRHTEQSGQLERLLLPQFWLCGGCGFRGPARHNSEASCSRNCQRRFDSGGRTVESPRSCQIRRFPTRANFGGHCKRGGGRWKLKGEECLELAKGRDSIGAMKLPANTFVVCIDGFSGKEVRRTLSLRNVEVERVPFGSGCRGS